MINVAIVEDDENTRDAWAVVLNGTPGFRCVSAHRTAEDALENLPLSKTDLVVVDLGLPRLSGVELIGQLKERRPKLLFCVLTVHEDPAKVFDSLKAGASGYILKKTPPGEILRMLEELVAGGAPMSPAIARKVAQFFHKLSPSSGNLSQITDREREVLHHIAQGASDKQIGSKLRISPNTVRNHVSKIYEKLRVHSRVEATAKYMGRP